MISTIQLDKRTKERLDELKVHSRETYNELLLRLLENDSLTSASRESLIETIEVLSDPKIMRNIAESLEEIRNGEYGTPLEEIEKQLV